MLVPPWPALTGSFGSPVTKTPTQPISHCFNPGTTKERLGSGRPKLVGGRHHGQERRSQRRNSKTEHCDPTWPTACRKSRRAPHFQTPSHLQNSVLRRWGWRGRGEHHARTSRCCTKLAEAAPTMGRDPQNVGEGRALCAGLELRLSWLPGLFQRCLECPEFLRETVPS